MSALEGERAGVGYAGLFQLQLDELLKHAQESKDASGRSLAERSDIRTKFVRLRAINRAMRLLMYKVESAHDGPDKAFVDSAIYKTLAGDISMQIAQLALEVTGLRGHLMEEDPFCPP